MSCSSDDDDDNTTSGFKSNFYIGEEKQDISELISSISYNESDKTINVLLMSENENKKLKQFHATFEDIDFNTLKVGDDLIQKADMVNYLLGVNKDSKMYTMVKDPYDTAYKGYIGKAVIKTIDVSKKYLEIDFQNATVVGGTSLSKVEQKIKGSIGSLVEFRN
ncbi:MAG: hypothetical protein ACK5KT_14265 [Dysgonomonas sp.]